MVESMVKSLIVFYSRDGSTRKVANSLSLFLNSKTAEILDKTDRSGPLGYLLAGKDASLEKMTNIICPIENSNDYDLIVVGTPVWAWNVSPPIRTYLFNNRGNFKKIAFFCTMGGSGGNKTFNSMESISGLKPLGTLELTSREISSGTFEGKTREFANFLLKMIQQSP
jgi:flavodoxin